MFKKKKKNEVEEVLTNHAQAIQELQDQVKVLQHTVKYGVDGIEVELYSRTDPFGIVHLATIGATYIHKGKVYTVTSTIKKEIWELYKRCTSKVEVLLNNVKHIIFELKINDRGAIQTYAYMVDKEIEAICEYPQIEVTKNE